MSQGQGVTIADMAAAQQIDLKRGSLEIVADEFQMSDLMPFTSTNGAMMQRKARINPDDQPPQNYRNLNSDGLWTAGSMESINEHLVIYHAATKIDKYILGDTTLLWNPRQQVEFINRQLAREVVNAFINGNPDTVFNTDGSNRPASQPAGMIFRLKNPTQYGIDQDMWNLGITGASIDLSGTITQTIANNLYDSLDENQRNVKANVLFMNKRALTLFARSWRLGGMLETTQDQLGRKWKTILGMRIIEPGLKGATRRIFNVADTTFWAMPWTDIAGANTPTAAAASRYGTFLCANVGADHVEGLTAQGMSQEGPTKLPPPAEASAFQVSFAYGFFVNTPHDIAGLYGVKLG